MNNFERIFPFPIINQQTFEDNLLTGIWVLITIAIAIAAFFYILSRGKQIKKSLNSSSRENEKELKPIWDAYQSTFSYFGNTKKTSVHAEEYLNESNIFHAFLNFRLVNNISNGLVGMGILGTFVGLTIGISGIKTTEGTDQLASSIDGLMSGMSTAFVTSIWGMGLSLIFTAYFKYWQTRIFKTIQNTCFRLDQEFKITEDDFQKHSDQKQKEIISELFNEYLVAETSEGRQLPKNVFRRILEESEKQTASLQSFSDDLADSITAAMELMVSENNTQISKLIEEKLVPVLNDLKEIKQDSGTQIIENAVQRLSDSMKEMLQEFKSSISGDTREELEGLAMRLTTVSESLTKIPDTMTDISLQVAEMVEALKETVIANIKASKAEAAAQSEETRQAFISAKKDYANSVEDIQAHMELMLSSQKDNIKQVSDLTEKIKETLTHNSQVNLQFDGLVQKTKEISKTFETLTSSLNNNSQQITATSNDLYKSTREFNLSIENYVKKNHELIGSQRDILTKTVEVSNQYIEKFNIIELGLKGIFSQVQVGLKDYQNTTAENLNRYLREFTTHLTNAQKGLESNISNLSEIADELTEQVEKFNNKK